ncbi:MAG: hypothetical protein SVX43_16905 [Cyanobacteriota bacterium]|nr:hypothetical protein [Cyanobacteriota bacterium]
MRYLQSLSADVQMERQFSPYPMPKINSLRSAIQAQYVSPYTKKHPFPFCREHLP